MKRSRECKNMIPNTEFPLLDKTITFKANEEIAATLKEIARYEYKYSGSRNIKSEIIRKAILSYLLKITDDEQEHDDIIDSHLNKILGVIEKHTGKSKQEILEDMAKERIKDDLKKMTDQVFEGELRENNPLVQKWIKQFIMKINKTKVLM